MVNFKKLADRAKKARDVVEQQGGADALKDKAERMRDVATGKGSVGDKAKAAAEVAREKPNPAAPAPAENAGPAATPAKEPIKQGSPGEDPPAAQ